MTLPTFLVVGAARSGTTSLYHYLGEHPEVFVPKIKEINYFSYTPSFQPSVSATTLQEYERLFSMAPVDSARGEVSPSYLTSPTAPQRIMELVPDVRIIVILRNPVDRVFGAYRFGIHEGTEKRTPEEALRPGPTASYIRGAILCPRLSRYYELFDRDRIRIYRYEDLRSPKALLSDMFEFIGVDPDFEPNTDIIHNRGWVPRSQTLNWITRMNPVARRIREAMPEALQSRLRELRRFNETSGPELTPELRAELDAYFKEDVLQTQELTGLDLSAWL